MSASANVENNPELGQLVLKWSQTFAESCSDWLCQCFNAVEAGHRGCIYSWENLFLREVSWDCHHNSFDLAFALISTGSSPQMFQDECRNIFRAVLNSILQQETEVTFSISCCLERPEFSVTNDLWVGDLFGESAFGVVESSIWFAYCSVDCYSSYDRCITIFWNVNCRRDHKFALLIHAHNDLDASDGVCQSHDYLGNAWVNRSKVKAKPQLVEWFLFDW